MTFDEYWEARAIVDCLKPLAEHAWEAATAEALKNPPNGWYCIGEDVEIQDISGRWHPAKVTAQYLSANVTTDLPADVRRKPVWTPQEGEAVLVKSDVGVAFAAVSAGGNIYTFEAFRDRDEVKPFNADNIGKPWEEI